MTRLKNNRYICLFIFLAGLMVFCSVMSFAQSEDETPVKPVTTTTSTQTTASNAITTTTQPDQEDKPVIVTPKNITVCVDAGHGWADNGAFSLVTDENGSPLFFEKDINLAISKHLRDKLEAMGYTVVMIRESDSEISPAGIASDNICNISRRVSWVNSQSDIELMISIHCDSFSNTSVNGTRVYYNTDKHEDIYILGSSIKDSLIDSQVASKAPLLYDESNKLWSLTASKVPAILVECGFITGDSDLALLTDSNYQKAFGESLALAVDQYFTQIKGDTAQA